jgi:hypothetical protein
MKRAGSHGRAQMQPSNRWSGWIVISVMRTLSGLWEAIELVII